MLTVGASLGYGPSGEVGNAGRERGEQDGNCGPCGRPDRKSGRSAAGDAVDAVFEAIAETLARGEDVRIAGFGTFGTRSRPARTGAQSEDRREPEHCRLDHADLQGRQVVAGCRQRRRIVMGVTGDRGHAGDRRGRVLNSAACRMKTARAPAGAPACEKSSRSNGLTQGRRAHYRRADETSRYMLNVVPLSMHVGTGQRLMTNIFNLG